MTPAVRTDSPLEAGKRTQGVVVGNCLSESRQDGSALDHLPTPTRYHSDSHAPEGVSNYFLCNDREC